ncbi:MAG: hypothetical protein QW067_08890 [Thermofilaceae archaeon]
MTQGVEKVSSQNTTSDWRVSALRLFSVVLLVVSTALFVIPQPYVRDRLEVVLLVGVLLSAVTVLILLLPSRLVFLIPPAILAGGMAPIAFYIYNPLIGTPATLLGQLMPAVRVVVAVVLGTIITLMLILGILIMYNIRYCVEPYLRLESSMRTTGQNGESGSPPRAMKFLNELSEKGLGYLMWVEILELAIISIMWALAAHPTVLRAFELVAEMQPGYGLHEIVAEVGAESLVYTTILGLFGIISSIYDMLKIRTIVRNYIRSKCAKDILKNLLKKNVNIGESEECVLIEILNSHNEKIDSNSIQKNCSIQNRGTTDSLICSILSNKNIVELLKRNYIELVCSSSRKVREYANVHCRVNTEDDTKVLDPWNCRWYQKISLSYDIVTFLAPPIIIPLLLILL